MIGPELSIGIVWYRMRVVFNEGGWVTNLDVLSLWKWYALPMGFANA